MKLHIILDVTKTDGSRQDRDAVFEAISQELEGIEVYAQDDQHEDESSYEITVVGFGPTAKDATAMQRQVDAQARS